MARSKRVTQPQRRFTPKDLAAIPREDRRKLVQLLLDDAGLRAVDFQSPAAYDELILEAEGLWRPRRVRVRIADRPVTQADVKRIAVSVRDAGEAEGILIAPLGADPDVTVSPAIMLVGPAELISLLERCALIAWPGRQPVLAYDRVATQRALTTSATLLDRVGLQWLPTLARNELPAALGDQDLAPQDLLERFAFRMLTGSLRFGGDRYGEAARGQRLPDATLLLPGETRLAALLDCKASADGYVMDSDHYLRFTRYVETLRPDIERNDNELRFMIVLSSDFTGSDDARHPFHGRARVLAEETGLTLVYVRAADLAHAATAIEARDLQPAEREALDWNSAFARGQVSVKDLNSMIGRD